MLLAVMGVFSSCSNKVDDLYNPDMTAALKNAQYNRAFLSQFGNIDPYHTWGFNNLDARVSKPEAVDNPQNLGITHPADVTAAEIEKVTNWFKTHQNPESVSVSWSDFWVQKVSSNSEYDQWMKYLKVNGEDVERFNNSEGDGDKMYVVNSNTTNFSYRNTHEEGENNDHYDYVICEIDGQYYVGFDFMSNKSGEEIALDGYYWDWIVKITPGNYSINTHRIIAEDLGDIGDFDFNDVVFDVRFYEYWDSTGKVENAAVTLRAAGGTLPLYICYNNSLYEVHQLFGVEQDDMVNTDPTATNKPVAIITLEGCTSLNQISVKVQQENGELITLSANQGQAPGMICVDSSFEWPAERQNIEDKYPKFADYVGDQSVTWY